MNKTSFIATSLLIAAASLGLSPIRAAESNRAPLACNLKAFQPGERAQWKKLIDRMKDSVTVARELTDGWALQIDTARMPVVDLAQWISLERKCCPFFDFEVDLHGVDGSVWMSLKGGEGVKEFIAQDFQGLQAKFVNARKSLK